MDLGNGHGITFSNSTFVPVSDKALAAANGTPISAQPYFMSIADAETTFNQCKWIAPVDYISPLTANGSSSVRATLCRFSYLNPTRYSVRVDNGNFTNCRFSVEVNASATELHGISVKNGIVANCNMLPETQVISGTPRTSGYLIHSDTNGTCVVSGNTYAMWTTPNRYISSNVAISGCDGGGAVFSGINGATADIDLEKYTPNTHFSLWAQGGCTINSITGAPNGRTLKLYVGSTGTGTTVKGTQLVKNAGFGDRTIPIGATANYEAIAGSLHQLS